MPGFILKQSAYRSALIVICSLSLALIVNSIRPDGIDLFRAPTPESSSITITGSFREISIEDAFDRHKKKQALFLDSRSPDDFAIGHIKGALNQPDKRFDDWADDFISRISADTPLIVYCSNRHCSLAQDLAEKLSLIGYENVFYMAAGWDEWKRRALPMDILE